MTEPTTDELADKLASLRRKMVAAATDQTTPEQRAEWKAADEAMAQRIRKARPGILPHHALATLETLRAIQRYDAGAESMTDERAAELLAPLEAKARALHAQKDAEHRAVVLREAAAAIQDVIDRDRARSAARSNDRAALGAARQIVLALIDGPGGVASETQQDGARDWGDLEATASRERGMARDIVTALSRKAAASAGQWPPTDETQRDEEPTS